MNHMSVDERGKCADVQIRGFARRVCFLHSVFRSFIMSLIMKRLYIHMSSLYIHEMAKRKQKKFLLLTLRH
jgi:hypothetical protein